MASRRWFGVVLLVLLPVSSAVAQQAATPDNLAQKSADTHSISLDVVVAPKGGDPVAHLTQQDFTILDNNVPQNITSFKEWGGKTAPVGVIIVVDAVNTSFSTVAFEKDQIDKFLRSNGGKLVYPTTLAIFTDKDTQIQNAFTQDGNALAVALDNYEVGLRYILRSSGFYGAGDRVQLGINALQMLAAREATLPGRKIVLWVSPGWPLLTGPRVELGPKDQEGIFNAIVQTSTDLRQARITLYSIDPYGAAEAGSNRLFYYQSFLKGIRKPSQTDIADISLQVIATQSGGLVLNASNDLTGLLQKAMADTNAFYEMSFTAGAGEPNEYHQIKVNVAKPGLVARTRTGYYSQP
jgi:VWFA-related protein